MGEGINKLLEEHNRILGYLTDYDKRKTNHSIDEGYEGFLYEEDPEEAEDTEELDFGNAETGDEGSEELGGNTETADLDLGGDEGGNPEAGDEMGDLEDLDLGDEEGGEELDLGGNPEVGDEMEMGDDDEEIDVTDFIEKSQDLTSKVDSQVDQLNQQLSDLTKKISSMDQVLTKIDKVEKDIKDMRPQKPIETLKLRSLDSYPYNQGLDSYWSNKQKELQGLKKRNRAQEVEEYILTPEDVENYSDVDVKNSLNPGHEEQNNFDRIAGQTGFRQNLRSQQ